MAGLLVFTLFCFWSFTDSHLIKAPPAVHQSHGAAGVFLLLEDGKYTFNFTAARDACLFLNVTMATRDQMERALQRGLQTCKFGWIAEQVAVVPRLTADEKCGKGKTGVVPWAARTDREFGAFCFNTSALWETQNASTASPQSSTPSTEQTAVTRTPPPPAPALTVTAESPPSRKMTPTKPASEGTSFTPAPHANTTPPTRLLSASTAREPPPSSPHLPSEPSDVSLAFSTSAYASFTSESATHPPVSSGNAPLGDVSTALIVLGILALLMSAAGVVWYNKLNIFTFWTQVQRKEDIETEMWKHTDSEMDLHSQHEGEGEETERKYSSDITLCVNPDIKTNSSE